MLILLVEDDAKISSFIMKGLKQAGYSVKQASDGEEGLHFLLTESFDVAIIDIMLPKSDGLAIIREIRKKNIVTPVLILSAKNTVDDRVCGLQTGSDDYLVKPFAFSELLARIQALIRRASHIAEPTTLTVADLSLDIVRRKVFRGGTEIVLQPLEFSLLEYLMRNTGKLVSKTMIMEHVWDYNFDPQTNVVEVRICSLRAKIDRPFSRKLLNTIKGAGYVLEER